MRKTSDRADALHRVDRVVVFAAFVLLGAMALSSPLYAALSGMRSAGCTRTCDVHLLEVGAVIIAAAPVGVSVAAVLGLLLLPRPDRFLWWLPCSALAAATAAALLGNHLIDLAVDH